MIRIADKRHYALLFAILALSAYVHLWNPAGFPDLFFDEGVYMRRAANVLETGSPQEASFYDHPYMGQLVLAGFLKVAGFPDAVQHDLEASYLVPRVLMGLFAVLDTFLVYKIAGKKFDRRVAVIAATLFAVMPFTWILRRILLDAILLPFLLSSILAALHVRDSKNPGLLILASATLLGLAIFTKVTAVTMIPVVAYVIYAGARSGRDLARWIPPVLAIPAIWPATSLALGELDAWLGGVFWQAGRGSGSVLVVVFSLFNIDPVLLVLGLASVAFAVYRRDAFLLFWYVPFLLFVSAVGFLQYFHFILLLPAVCIGAALMIRELFDRPLLRAGAERYCTLAACAILAFGASSTSLLITEDLTSGQFEALDLLVHNFDGSDATLLASPVYSWVLSDVYKRDNVLADYSGILFEPVRTRDMVLVADPHFFYDIGRGPQLQEAYDSLEYSTTIHGRSGFATEPFPYGSMMFAREGELIEIRASWDLSGELP